MTDKGAPARLVSLLLFGCPTPSVVQQRLTPVAMAKLREFVEYSVSGGYCQFPSETHVQSSIFVQQIADMMTVVSPPVIGCLRIETQLVHIAVPNNKNGFSLCFAVSKMNPEQRQALQVLLDNPKEYFETVRYANIDATLSIDERPPPRCSQCFYNDEITAVLARADFLTLAMVNLRQIIRCDGDTWCVFQCLLDQVAQNNELVQKKPSFSEFYYSIVRSWDELRPSQKIGQPVSPIHLSWAALTRVRAAHFVTRGQRVLAAEYFAMQKEKEDKELNIVHGFETLYSVVIRKKDSLSPETIQALQRKPVFMATAYYCRGAGKETLRTLYQHADMHNVSPVARALIPYAWPPHFQSSPEIIRPGKKAKTNHHKTSSFRRAVKVTKSVLFLLTELSAEFFAPDLSLVQWYSAWFAVCRAKQTLPALREAQKRPLAAALAHITSLFEEPQDEGTAQEMQAVAEKVVGAIFDEYEVQSAFVPRYLCYNARFWHGGTLDSLSEFVALRSHFFEMNAIVRAFEFEASEKIVLELQNVPRGMILSAHFSAQGVKGIEAVALEDAVLLIGSRSALEWATITWASFAGVKYKHYSHLVEVLAWTFCADEPEAAAHIVATRYKMTIEPGAPIKKFGELTTRVCQFFRKQEENINDRAILGGVVRELVGLENASLPWDRIHSWQNLAEFSENVLQEAEELPLYSRTKAAQASHFDFCYCEVSASARAMAEFVLQVPRSNTTNVTHIWNEMPIFLKSHPLQHLCDGTTGSVSHPLWSVCPDLLRIVAHAAAL